MAVKAARVETSGITTKPVLIELAGVRRSTGPARSNIRALRGVDLSIDDGDMVAIVGPSGQRQVDDHEHDHRHRPPDSGHGHGRRPADRRDERGGARGLARASRRRRVPVLPAAADADRARERDAAAGLLAPRAQARARARGAAQSRARRAGRQGRPPAVGAFGRPAAARRDRARAGGGPAAADRRRADRQPRHAHRGRDVRAAARLNAEGTTVLYVTHDLELAARAHRVVTIRDGVVAADEEAVMLRHRFASPSRT